MATTNSLDIEINVNAANAATSLDLLTQKLNALSVGFKTTNTPGSKTTNVLESLFKSGNKSHGMFSKLNTVTYRLASSFGMLYAAAFPLVKLSKKIWSATQDAMDYVETYNYFKVTMSKIGSEAGESFSNSYLQEISDLNQKMTGYILGSNGELLESGTNNLGLDPEALMNFQARIGAVTNSVGLLADASISTQKALTMLSADLSSLTNTDLDSVMTNLSSGLIGQSRALYKYGIDITNATLSTYAYKYGIEKSVSAMTQAEKMQLRVLAILDQSKVAWGDQINTLNSVANQYRVLKQQISNLGRVLGNLFLPIVSKVLPYLNALVIVLRRLLTLVGFKIYGDNWLSDVNEGISSGNFEDISDGIDDVDDSLDSANSSAKELKRTLLGFDEINALNAPDTSSGSSSSSSSGGGGIDLSDAIADALGEYESVWDKAFEDMQNKAEELADTLMDYFEREDFKELGNLISHKLTKVLQGIPWEKIYKVAENSGKGFADFLNGLINPNLFGEFGKTIAGAINTAILTYKSFWTNFDGANLGKSIASGINKFFREIKAKDLAEGLNAFVDTIEDAIKAALGNLNWSRIFGKIGDFIGNLEFDTIVALILLKNWKKIFSWFKVTLIPLVGTNILSSLKTNIPVLLTKVGDSIMTAITGNQVLSFFLVGIKEFIGNIVTAILPELAVFGPIIGAAAVAMFSAMHVFDSEIVNILGADFEDLRDNVEDCADTLDNFSDKLSHTWDTYQDTLADSRADYSQIDTLIDRYDQLTSKSSLSKKEQSDLKNVVEELCEQLPTLNGFYDEETGLLTITTDELKKLNEQKLEEAKLDAQKQMLTDYYKTYYEAVDALEEAYEYYNQAVEQNATDHELLDEKLQNHEINRWEYNKSLEASNQLVSDAKATVEDYSGKVDEAAGKVNDWSNKLYGINEVVDTSTQVISGDADTIKSKTGDVDDAVSGLDETINTTDTDYGTLSSDINDNEITPRTNTTALERLHDLLGSIKDKFEGLLSEGLINISGGISLGVNGYATGGMPAVGSLFIAGESGAELVAHGSQGTEVLNESQISNAIRSAVVDGMMEAMVAMNSSSASSGGTVEIPLYLDGMEVARATANNMDSLIRSGQLRPNWI